MRLSQASLIVAALLLAGLAPAATAQLPAEPPPVPPASACTNPTGLARTCLVVDGYTATVTTGPVNRCFVALCVDRASDTAVVDISFEDHYPNASFSHATCVSHTLCFTEEAWVSSEGAQAKKFAPCIIVGCVPAFDVYADADDPADPEALARVVVLCVSYPVSLGCAQLDAKANDSVAKAISSPVCYIVGAWPVPSTSVCSPAVTVEGTPEEATFAASFFCMTNTVASICPNGEVTVADRPKISYRLDLYVRTLKGSVG
jgi:hypothetical protein